MPFLFATWCMMGAMAVPANPPAEIELWPKGNPDGWTRKEAETRTMEGDILLIRNVSKPTVTLSVSPSAKKGAPTVLVCPGGGYGLLASGHEGSDIVAWLNENGIHAALLKYRLPVPDVDKVRYLPGLQDAQRAMRILRSAAADLGLDAAKIGIMGFSAGGHLSAMASTAPDAYSKVDAMDDLPAKPNFTVLVYGAYMDTEGKAVLAPEVKVGKDTPPAFLAHTMDDRIPVESSLAYALALKSAGVDAEVHLFPKGGHGYGLRSKEPGIRDWPKLLLDWLLRR